MVVGKLATISARRVRPPSSRASSQLHRDPARLLRNGRVARVSIVCLVTLLAHLLVGCPGTPRPDNAYETAPDLLGVVESRFDQVQDVRISALADYYDENEGQRVVGRDVSISAKAPASLRVSLSSFGKVLASMASDGENFSLFDLQNEKYYFGPATTQNLSRLVPIHLSGDDFVRVLRGGFPTEELADDWRERAELGWNGDSGQYRLEAPTRTGGMQIVEMTHPDLGVALIRVEDEGGKALYLYQGKDFETHEGIPLPAKSRFEVRSKDITVDLRIEGVDVNVAPPGALFQIAPPPAAEKIPVGGGS